MIKSVDFYNLTANCDGATKTLNSAATDTDHIPCVLSVSYGMTFDANYGNKTIYETSHTCKVGTAPGWYSGVVTIKSRNNV